MLNDRNNVVIIAFETTSPERITLPHSRPFHGTKKCNNVLQLLTIAGRILVQSISPMDIKKIKTEIETEQIEKMVENEGGVGTLLACTIL